MQDVEAQVEDGVTNPASAPANAAASNDSQGSNAARDQHRR